MKRGDFYQPLLVGQSGRDGPDGRPVVRLVDQGLEHGPRHACVE